MPEKLDAFKETIWQLFEESGKIPSQRDVLNTVGKGSLRDVNQAHKEWMSELADLLFEMRHRPEMPDEIWNAMRDLWKNALDQGEKLAAGKWDEARARLEQQLEATKSRQAELEQALEDTRGQNEVLQQNLATAEKAREQLEEEHALLEEQLEKARARGDELKTQNQRLEDKVKNLQIRLEEEQAHARQSLESRERHLKDLIRTQQEKAEELREDLRAVDKEKTRLEKELAKEKELSAGLRAESKVLKEERDRLVGQAEDYHKEVVQLTTQLSETEAAAQTAIMEMKQKIVMLESDLAGARRILATVTPMLCEPKFRKEQK